MDEIVIKTGTSDDFFRRGRELARAADRGQALPKESRITFDDPADIAKRPTMSDKPVWSASGHR